MVDTEYRILMPAVAGTETIAETHFNWPFTGKADSSFNESFENTFQAR